MVVIVSMVVKVSMVAMALKVSKVSMVCNGIASAGCRSLDGWKCIAAAHHLEGYNLAHGAQSSEGSRTASDQPARGW